MAIPSVLKAYSLFVDGNTYAGKADVQLPELSVVTEEFGHGGMSADIKVDMGKLAAVDCSFTLYEYDAAVLGMFGLIDGGAVNVKFRGALANDSGDDVRPVIVECRGQMQTLSNAAWESGSKTSLEATINCRFYRMEVDGTAVHEVDAENMTRVINGVDQMAALRNAIGA